MLNWILPFVIGLVVAIPLGIYMVALGSSIMSVIMLCLLVFGYVAAVISLIKDE